MGTFTFGNSEIEAGLSNQTSTFPIYVMTDDTETHYASRGDKVTKIWLYGVWNSGNTGLEVGIWDITHYNTDNIEKATLAGSATITFSASLGWHSVDVNIPLTAGRRYAVGFASARSSSSIGLYRSTTDNKNYARSSSTGLDNLVTSASSFPVCLGGIANDRHYSIYATGETEAASIDIVSTDSLFTIPKVEYIPSSADPSTGNVNFYSSSDGLGTIYYPRVVLEGDIAYLWVFVGDVASNANVILSADNTWIPVTDKVFSAAAGDEAAARLFWRRCSGVEGGSNTIVTFDNTGSIVNLRMGQIFTVSGANKTRTPHEDFQITSGGATVATSANTTTLGPKRLLIRLFAIAEDDQGPEPTPPSGWTRAQDIPSGAGSDGTFTIDYKEASIATTEAATTRAASFDSWITFSFAVVPKLREEIRWWPPNAPIYPIAAYRLPVAKEIFDTFNRPDETALKYPWKKIAGSDTGITNGVVTRAATNEDTMYINEGISKYGDQWAEMRIVSGATQTDVGPLVRMKIIGTGENGYVFNAYTGGPGIYRLTNSMWTLLAATIQPVNGDITRIEARGQLITAYVNNKLVASIRDNDHPYGYPGFHHFEAACQWDNFRAGEIKEPRPILLHKAETRPARVIMHTTTHPFVNARSSYRGAESAYLGRTTNLPSHTSTTICGWFRYSYKAGYASPFGIGSTAQGTDLGIMQSSDATAFFFTDYPATGSVFWSTNPPKNQLIFFAATKQGIGLTDSIGYYRTAAQKRLLATTPTSGSDYAWNVLKIGTSAYDGTDYWLGDVWNVRVWDRVLTEAELLAESYSMYPLATQKLNGWYPLEGRPSDMCVDRSMAQNHLTVNGSPLVGHGLDTGLVLPQSIRLMRSPSAVHWSKQRG